MNTETKKIALLATYQILQKYSDYEHPLSGERIVQHLIDDYGITLERKAVMRNINCLKEFGIPIESKKTGSYIEERTITDGELLLVIDSINTNTHLSNIRKQDLIEKLKSIPNIYHQPVFKNLRIVESTDQYLEDLAFFYDLEKIDQAITLNRKIKFDASSIFEDNKLHKVRDVIGSPYEIVVKDNNYYVAILENGKKEVDLHRIDRLAHVEILDEIALSAKQIKKYL